MRTIHAKTSPKMQHPSGAASGGTQTDRACGMPASRQLATGCRSGAVAQLAQRFETGPKGGPQASQRLFQLCAPPAAAVVSRALQSPLPPDAAEALSCSEQYCFQASTAPLYSDTDSGPSCSGGPGSQPHQKRQRVLRMAPHAVYPPMPPTTPNWLNCSSTSSSSGGDHGSGDGAAGAAERVGRQLWPAGARQPSSPDVQARESRLAKIREKFGTKRFHAARQLAPAELRSQLGASEADLSPDDYLLYRWSCLPVLLGQTSNGYCKNWVLTGQSGCVGLASSLTHLFVLGAGQTIYLEEADAVHAVQDEVGVYVRLGSAGFLTVKVPDPKAASNIIATINARAATRAALRHKQQQQQRQAAAAPGRIAGAVGL